MTKQSDGNQKEVSKTKICQNFDAIIQQLEKDNEHFIVKKSGIPVAALLSITEYERLLASERVTALSKQENQYKTFVPSDFTIGLKRGVTFGERESFHTSAMPLVLADIEREINGVTLVYALDYCEIHDYIFSSFGLTERVIAYYLRHLDHQMILLPPTVLEMFKNLEGLSTWYRRAYHKKAEVVDDFLKSKKVQKFLLKVSQAKKLEDFEEVWHDLSRLEANDQRILNLFFEYNDSEMLGDPERRLEYLFQEERLRIAEIAWEEFDENVFSEAYDLFQRRRPTLDKRFANRVDAMNVAIVYALNSKYTSESGGQYYSLVTHGAITQDVWSSLEWNDDPLRKQVSLQDGLETIPLCRSPYDCAYHAFFDSAFDDELDRLHAVRKYLVELKEVEALLKRNTNLSESESQRLDSLMKYSREIIQVIVGSPPQAKLRENLSQKPLNLDEGEIKDLLEKRTVSLQETTRVVYEIVEADLNEYRAEIIDHKSKEFIGSIQSPDSTPLEPLPRREKFIAKARLPLPSDSERLYVNKEYQLEVQIRWHIPEDQSSEMDFLDGVADFEIIVHAEDMKVTPYEYKCSVKSGKASPWQKFTLTPIETGTKRIYVFIRYKGHFIGLLEYERNVLKGLTSSEQQISRPNHSLTIPRKELFIPSEYVERPIHLSLDVHFDSSKKKHWINIRVPERRGTKPILSDLSEGGIAEISRDLQNGLEEIVDAYFGGGMIDKSKLLEKLAYEGNNAYKTLFPQQETQQYIQDILMGGNPAIISITSISPFFPLELLYDHSMEEEPSYEHFWGMRYIVERDIINHNDHAPDADILIKGAPRVALLPYTKLTHVEEVEIPFFREMENLGKVVLSIWTSSSRQDREEKMRFSEFLNSELEMVHFACHAETKSEKESDSVNFVFSNDFEISGKDFRVYNFEMNKYPLVVLNACRTSVVNPLHTANLVTVIQNYGGRGVVATECRVPDAFGAEFTKQLYGHLIDEGKDVGRSLLEVRRHFLREKNNPLGLLYTLYGPAGIKLVKQ